jgi:excisionase family DNA binding protein
MSAQTDDLELTQALPELRQQHGVAATYHRLWVAVVEGRIPAVRVGKRWKIRRSDLPRAATALGPHPAPAG